MKKIAFKARIRKYGDQGEKTGWTYIEIPPDLAQQLKPGNKKSFRVKGTLDDMAVNGKSLLPVGDGFFILPVNATMRRKLRKKEGAMVTVELSEDKKPFQFNKDFIACLKDEPDAMKYFQSLPGSHQRYFSSWIDSAKTTPTKVKRIAMAVNALARGMGYAEMLREASAKK